MLSALSQKYTVMPTCELLQDAAKYIANIEIPGVPKDQIKIQKENTKIIIKAKKENPFKDMKVKSLFPRDFGTYSLSYSLPDDADVEKLKAALKDGVLTITVPKHQKEIVDIVIE